MVATGMVVAFSGCWEIGCEEEGDVSVKVRGGGGGREEDGINFSKN